MLGATFGGLRPWELQDFKASELRKIGRHRDALIQAREGQDGI